MSPKGHPDVAWVTLGLAPELSSQLSAQRSAASAAGHVLKNSGNKHSFCFESLFADGISFPFFFKSKFYTFYFVLGYSQLTMLW